MSDIRSFFGGPGVQPKKLSAPALASDEQASKLKKPRVVVSDNEEEEEFDEPPKPKKETKTMDAEEMEDSKEDAATVAEAEIPEPKREENAQTERSGTTSAKSFSFVKSSSSKKTTAASPEKKKSSVAVPKATASKVPLEKVDSILYSDLAELFEKVSDVSSRLAIQEEMKNFFLRVIETCPDDLLRTVYLSINSVAPAFEGAELGVGDSILVRAISEVTGRSKDALQTQYKELGDLGSVALAAKTKQSTLFGMKPKPLTVLEVFSQLRNIVKVSGNKSMEHKVGIIKKMLIAASGTEAKFIVRGLQGKLRIGLAEQTVIVSLAHAVNAKHKEDGEEEDLSQDDAVAIVKQCYSECPSYDEMVPAMVTNPLSRLLEVCHIRVGVPVKPMLAKPTKGIGEVLNRFETSPFTCEFKYDGERAQIHRLANGEIRVFSRNLEDNTSKYPDVIEAVKSALAPGNSTFIVDAEVVAYDRSKKLILPFQILSTRARKDVLSTDDIKVQVSVFLFDLLYYNGESLLKQPLKTRRDTMQKAFMPVEHKVQFAIGKDLASTEDILEFFNESVKGNCEGLMIKTLEKDASYEPSKRSLNWLKLKKDYMENLSDSVDLVPIGAYYGRGKRTGVYGGYLLACFEPDSEELQSVCKVATGFSEEALEEHTNFFKDKVIPEKRRDYITGLECDVWLDACVVWEIKAADLSISPVHKGAVGSVKPDKGIGLRFPRFIRKRDDKKVDDATSAQQIEQMYREQAVISQNAGGDDDEDDW